MTVWTIVFALIQHLKVGNSFACVVHLFLSQSWTFSCAIVNEHHCIMLADKSLIEILMSVWFSSRKKIGLLWDTSRENRILYGIWCHKLNVLNQVLQTAVRRKKPELSVLWKSVFGIRSPVLSFHSLNLYITHGMFYLT